LEDVSAVGFRVDAPRDDARGLELLSPLRTLAVSPPPALLVSPLRTDRAPRVLAS
jgi:hypothetical protein